MHKMTCKCGNPMDDLGTAAGGVFVRWCPRCGSLYHRSMNPRFPGETWEYPKKKTNDHSFNNRDLHLIFSLAYQALTQIQFPDSVRAWREPQGLNEDRCRRLHQELDKHLFLSEQRRFKNHYYCDRCNFEWEDEWFCMCNDRCPKCNTEIEPLKSEEIK